MMRVMDANTARTENMRRLVANVGGPAEWTRRYGGERWQQPQVSQWISGASPKSIGKRLARDLEAAMGLEFGLLDRVPSGEDNAKLDVSALYLAHQLMRLVAEIRGELLPPAIDMKRLALAYEVIKTSRSSDTIEAMRAFAAKLDASQARI